MVGMKSKSSDLRKYPEELILGELDMFSQQEMMVHFGVMYRQNKLAFISLQDSHYYF